MWLFLPILGVIARHPSYVPFLRRALTEEAVEKYFMHLFESKPEEGKCRVKRFVPCLLLEVLTKDYFSLRPQVAQAQHLYKRMYGHYSMVDFQRKY